MKILQVIPYFIPAYAFGGPVTVSFQITKELVKRGHKVVVYTSDVKDPDTRLTAEAVKVIEGVQVHYLRNLSTHLVKHLNFFITPKLLITAIKETKKFDVIHLHEYRTFQNLIIYHYAKYYNIPYILQAHGSLSRTKSKRILKWIYDVLFGYKLLRNASKVIALNRIEVDQYYKMGVKKENITIVPNGIDLTEYLNLPPKGSFKKKYDINFETKLILYLGRLHQSKRIDLLIESFSLVLNTMKHEPIILIIMGPNDGYLDKAKSLAESMGVIDSIFFTGFVSAEDKHKALVDANILVTPCFSGFPITFLEACTTGTPIITTILGDKLGWIDGKVGYATSPMPIKIADAIDRILLDEDLSNEFSENGKAIVKFKFSIEKVIERLEQIYK